FSHKGPAIIARSEQANLALLAITNSCVFRITTNIQTSFGSYEVGVIQRTPVPDLSRERARNLGKLAQSALVLKRSLDTANETSHVFHLPTLLQVPGTTLADRVAAWRSRVADTERQLAENQQEIDDIAFRLYGIEGEDRAFLEVPGASSWTSDA